MTDKPTSNITLHNSCYEFGEEVIRIDKEGFHYRGQFIADAGEAHRLMVEFLRQQTQPEPQGPTDEEILALSESHNISYNCIDGRVEYPCREGYDMREDVLSYSRAVLARWGK